MYQTWGEVKMILLQQHISNKFRVLCSFYPYYCMYKYINSLTISHGHQIHKHGTHLSHVEKFFFLSPIYIINNMIPYLGFNILHTKIPSYKFLNSLK